MRAVQVRSVAGGLAQQITIGAHRVVADEPAESGGTDSGPAPTELLLAALGGCIAMTLRMYADRKDWPLRDVQVALAGHEEDGRFVVTRRLTLEGDLSDEQRARLADIAGRCPVARRLTAGVDLRWADGVA